MVEKKEKTREEVIADYISEKHAAAKSSRKARRVDDGDATVTINSLMDAMTIILVFLLMNYSIDPLKVDGGDDMQLPESTSVTKPTPTPVVTVSANSITVGDKELVVFEKMPGTVKVPTRFLKDQRANSLVIMPLLEELKTIQQNQETVSGSLGKAFDPKLTFIVHGEIPYKLVAKILATAAQTKFTQFRFAVISGGSRGADKR